MPVPVKYVYVRTLTGVQRRGESPVRLLTVQGIFYYWRGRPRVKTRWGWRMKATGRWAKELKAEELKMRCKRMVDETYEYEKEGVSFIRAWDEVGQESDRAVPWGQAGGLGYYVIFVSVDNVPHDLWRRRGLTESGKDRWLSKLGGHVKRSFA